jgi:hypothetical protein
MNYGLMMYRNRRGNGIGKSAAITFSGVSGAPDSGASPAVFAAFFQGVNNVDEFVIGVDRWGAEVVAGRYEESTQRAAEAAHARLVSQSTGDTYADFMLTQAAKSLQSAREIGQKQLASTVTTVATGLSIGAIVAIGVVAYLLLK